MKSLRLLLLPALLSVGAMLSTPCADAKTGDPDVLGRELLFNLGDNGSKFYRIPAIVTLADGTLVAVADKRIDSNGDLPGRIDVVCRTSSDNGATWTPAVTVAEHNEDGGYGDPALVVDRNTGDVICIATHGQGLWTGTPGNCARIVVMRSKDKGATWSAPLDITDQYFTSTGEADKPVKGVTGFASSGRALQLSDGRLMFVKVVRTSPEPGWSPLSTVAIYSDDGGYTWQSSGVASDIDGDEAKVVELSDGRVLMSIRNRKHGPRRFSISSDRGETWSEVYEQPELVDPACNGDLIAVEHNGRRVLLQSICADRDERRNVTIFASFDDGATWPVSKTVCPGPSAYSALTQLADGTIGIFVEENAADQDGFRLWFTRLNLDKLLSYGK